MTKYKRFMAAVGRLQDYRKPNPRPAVEATSYARRRGERDDVNDVARGMTGVGGEAISERNITLAAVRHALAHLPKHQRRMLILICVDGMSYKATAELLDVSIGTMAARVAGAREALDEEIALRSRPDIGCLTTRLEPARADAERGECSC